MKSWIDSRVVVAATVSMIQLAVDACEAITGSGLFFILFLLKLLFSLTPLLLVLVVAVAVAVAVVFDVVVVPATTAFGAARSMKLQLVAVLLLSATRAGETAVQVQRNDHSHRLAAALYASLCCPPHFALFRTHARTDSSRLQPT